MRVVARGGVREVPTDSAASSSPVALCRAVQVRDGLVRRERGVRMDLSVRRTTRRRSIYTRQFIYLTFISQYYDE